MNQIERMKAGLPYWAADEELSVLRREQRAVSIRFNALPADADEERSQLLSESFASAGEDVYAEAPFYFDFGCNITVGRYFYANYNCTILANAPVTIGDYVMLAPNVGIYTPGHPVHPVPRRSGWEYAEPVTIGNNVWIGANSVILPGVTIGDNTVVGAGSVVAKDLPANVIAAGNPCRVIRAVTEDDINTYFKHETFDIDWRKGPEEQ